MAATPTAGGSVATVCDSPTLTLKRLASQITTLSAGQRALGDTAEGESGLFFVKSGTVEVNIKGVASRLAAGSFFYCPSNEKVLLKNSGPTAAVYQTIRFVPGAAKER